MIIKYVNSINRTVVFNDASIKPSNGSFHKRIWNVETVDGKPNLTVTNCTYSITLTLKGNLEERKEQLDKICDILDYDCANNQSGKLYYGDYYINCFITSSSTGISSTSIYRSDIEFEIYCEKQEWIKEKFYNLVVSKEKVTNNNKKYTYCYPFVYSNEKNTISISNDTLIPCDFLLRVYGSCVNPFVKIGENVYLVETTLSNDEYLEINSKDKTIFAYSKYGDKRNLFAYRSKMRSNFFEKIASGSQQVNYSGDYSSELIIFEKRGEPKWKQ